MTGLALLLCGLAAYRLTRLAVLDSLTEGLRDRWWRRFGQDTKPGELAGCSYCAGWWVSGLVLLTAAGLGFAPWRWRTVALWPVVAGGQALLSALDERLDR